jgi:hypothetical protein
MTTATFANSRIGRLFIKALAAAMESRVRYRFFGPTPILRGADIHPGQAVLEVGCGTGFFTIPAARRCTQFQADLNRTSRLRVGMEQEMPRKKSRKV